MSVNEQNNRMLDLAAKWQTGKITEEEQKEFDRWYNSFEDTELKAEANETPEMLKKRLYTSILEKTQPAKTRIRSLVWKRIAVAASLLLILSFGGYFLTRNDTEKQVTLKKSDNNIIPGGNKATLTLADGSKLLLDESANGKIAVQGGISIIKAANGEIIYSISDNLKAGLSARTAYNTIETPRGGQYQINLPDGSKVWLNSSSSLRYPVTFTENERNVELTGEGYFEVAKSNKPFHVSVNDTKIEVLGTHFNIMSYEDEASTKTTLLEGSVRIYKGSVNGLLKPGQQAITSKKNSKITFENVDTEEVVAWKNGYFMFNNEDVQSIMRKVARWYNVDIIYQGDVSGKSLWGTMSRSENVSEVLKMLELTETVHFRIQGRRIIVMP